MPTPTASLPEGAGLQAVTQAVQRVKSPEFQMYYCNNTLVMSNQWDFQFYFSQIREAEVGKWVAQERAAVVMTPEHALAFSKALKACLEAYEAGQGKIREIKPAQVPSTPTEK